MSVSISMYIDIAMAYAIAHAIVCVSVCEITLCDTHSIRNQ